jgi:hypothetical protein
VVKVKEEAGHHLARVDVSMLDIWKTEGEINLDASKNDRKEVLKDIDFNDWNTIKGGEPWTLRPSDVQIMCGTSRISTAREAFSDTSTRSPSPGIGRI